jgi:hypothetical protein
MTSLGRALWLEMHHDPVDWLMLLGAAIVGGILAVVGIWFGPKPLAVEVTEEEKEPRFTPLQREIINLTRDFRTFLVEHGPAPIQPASGKSEQYEERRGLWVTKLMYNYKERFAGRVRGVATALGIAGIYQLDWSRLRMRVLNQSMRARRW